MRHLVAGLAISALTVLNVCLIVTNASAAGWIALQVALCVGALAAVYWAVLARR